MGTKHADCWRHRVAGARPAAAWWVVLAFAAVCGATQDVVSFTDSARVFNHLAVDRNTGSVYIGAVNRIYQLSPDLEVARSIVTGPVDSMDNANKALVMDYPTNRLITCGSVGLCSVRSLLNISKDVREGKQPVVASSASASTVAFIAPGPPNPPATRVMYVGVTFSGNSPYETEIPAVSSRSLEDDRLFTIARRPIITGTEMFVKPLARESYLINYVYGFSSEGFSYFITTQMRSLLSDKYYSKLVRVCHGDEKYHSYTEIPMSCTGGGGDNFGYNLVQAAFVGKAGSVLAGELGITPQDDVLFAAFSQGEAVNTNTPSNQSALCVYSLKAIRRKFTQNILACFRGHGSLGLDFITYSRTCTGTMFRSLPEDFCGLDFNTPLGGKQPVEAVPVAIFNTRLTAVAATSTGDHTVVFAGTVEGHLKKIVVESATSAFEYGDIVVDKNSPVNKDLIFDTQLMHLYVMTERKVSKVKVQECSVYESCSTCLGIKDPYCGWCSLENKCSLRSDCQDAAKDPLYWISYRSGRCTTITLVTPNQLQRTTARPLDLLIENLPTINGQFQCAFTASDRTLITNATRKPFGVTCATPRPDTLPPIPAGQHHFTAKLSVRTPQGLDFAATNVTFFDCDTYSSCTQCASSSFPCDWCFEGHRCTHDSAENCRNDIIVSGVSRIGPSYGSGPEFCPTIRSASDGTNEILVPFGVKKAIKVNIIGQFIVQTRFVCQFNIDGQVKQVNAQLLADTIYCDAVEFTYTSRAPNVTASFSVTWGGSKTIENPNDTHILIYRCNDMVDNCGTCLALPKKFGCGWCQSSDRCEVQDQCGAPSVWLNRTETCPNPEVRVNRCKDMADNCGTCLALPMEGCGWCQGQGSDRCEVQKHCAAPSVWLNHTETCPNPDIHINRCNDMADNCANCLALPKKFACGWCQGQGSDRCEIQNQCGAPSVWLNLTQTCPNPEVRVNRCNDMADNCGTCLALPKKFGCGWCQGQGSDQCEVQDQCGAPSLWLNLTETCPNPEVRVNRCNDMADNCANCLALPKKFGCGWCQGQGSDQCEVQDQCAAPSVWLNRKQTCPNSEIHKGFMGGILKRCS